MNIVKELRKRKGIQQKELAIEIGVSRPIVSEWESGKKDPSGERLQKLAEYFGVDPLWVLGIGVLPSKEKAPEIPKTVEARLLAKGVDTMPEETRKALMDMMVGLYPGVFKKGEEDET